MPASEWRWARIGMGAVCWALFAAAMPGCASDVHVISDKDKIADVIVAPVLETPLRSNINVIWCGTIQLAWNELAKMYGGPIRVGDPIPPIVEFLNRKEVDSSDFDPASYVAIAGTDYDGVYDRISQAMQDKFHGTQHSDLLKPTPPPANLVRFGYTAHAWPLPEIVAYAFLFKQLEFPTPFERLKQPIIFQGQPVAGFGIEADPDKPDEAVLADQVQILDYRNPENFIIELNAQSPADRLILAKIPPAATLGQTIERVEARIASSTPHPIDPDVPLRVPKMAFDITHDFDELIGHDLLRAGSSPGGQIKVARQIIKFRMDERGATLQSEFLAKAGSDASPEALIFDKPFLILMQRSNSKRPYFATWIGNARLLVGS